MLKNEERFLFFFSCFSLFKMTEICFGSTKMEIFYQELPYVGYPILSYRNSFLMHGRGTKTLTCTNNSNYHM